MPARLALELQPAFGELKAAVDEGADDVARGILRLLRPRCSDALSVRMAESYARILRGRAVRDAVQGSVVIEPVEGGFAVALELSQVGYQRLAIQPGHVRVEWTARSVDALGRQAVQIGGRIVEVALEWVLPAGEVVRVPLGEDRLQIGDGFLAVRCEWKVSLGAGRCDVNGERFPVQGLRVRDVAVVRLARELPTDAVEPAELLRYATGQSVRVEALLERAVRIPPASYAEALDLLAERVGDLAPARMQELVPVVAWLTGTSGIEASGEEWRDWLEGRRMESEGAGNLDLPRRAGR